MFASMVSPRIFISRFLHKPEPLLHHRPLRPHRDLGYELASEDAGDIPGGHPPLGAVRPDHGGKGVCGRVGDGLEQRLGELSEAGGLLGDSDSRGSRHRVGEGVLGGIGEFPAFPPSGNVFERGSHGHVRRRSGDEVGHSAGRVGEVLRVVAHVRVRVHLVGLPGGVPLQEPSEFRGVGACAVVVEARFGIPFASRVEPVRERLRADGSREGFRFRPERFPSPVREFPVRASEGGVAVFFEDVSSGVRNRRRRAEAVLQVVRGDGRSRLRAELGQHVVVGGPVRELGGTEDVSGQVGDGFFHDLPVGVRVRDRPVGKGFRNAASEGVVLRTLC